MNKFYYFSGDTLLIRSTQMLWLPLAIHPLSNLIVYLRLKDSNVKFVSYQLKYINLTNWSFGVFKLTTSNLRTQKLYREFFFDISKSTYFYSLYINVYVILLSMIEATSTLTLLMKRYSMASRKDSEIDQTNNLFVTTRDPITTLSFLEFRLD